VPERQVRVSLIIDEHGAVRALRNTSDQSGHTEGKLKHLDTQVRGLGKSFGGLKSMIGAGIGALGVGGMAYGIKSVVSGMQEMAGATEKFHAVSGIGAQQSLLTTAALKARGIDSEVGAKAFGFFTKNLQTAERQMHSYGVSQMTAVEKGKAFTGLLGVQATAFKELGINVGALSQMTGGQKLQTVVEAFEHMPPALRKAGDAGRLMKQVFGRGGEGLATVLEGGALGWKAMTKEAKGFFPTLKTGSLEEMRVQTARSNMAFEGLKFTLGQDLVPALIKADEYFVKSIRDVEHGRGAWGGFRKDIEGVVSAGKGVVGFFDGLGKAFNIKIGAGGLGAALMAFAGIKTAKAASKPIGAAAKAVKAVGKHPEAAPFFAGAAIPFASAYGIHAGVEGLSPGYLREHSIGEVNRSFLGGQNTGGGYGKTRGGGKAAGGGETPSEAALVSTLVAAMQPMAEAKVPLFLDSVKVAEAQLHNPRAIRILAEAVAKYAHNTAARR
jgi:hypothetical protein